MKTKKVKIAICVLIIALIALVIFLIAFNSNHTELKSIKSKKQLEKIYYGKETSNAKEFLVNFMAMPLMILSESDFLYYTYSDNIARSATTQSIVGPQSQASSSDVIGPITISPNTDAAGVNEPTSIAGSSSIARSSSKDYSTTNIQVENVDEADITKTDGDYIYSISESNVIITDVRNPENIRLAATIKSYGSAPEDLILYNNKLVVIYTESSSSRYDSSSNNTIVKVFDISDKSKPKVVKSYTLYEPYYTSRCIDNNLYVISSGFLRTENKTVVTNYTENSEIKEIPLNNIKYFTDIETKKQTLISKVDLNDTNKDININSYLIDISNSYVSENAIYLLNEDYEGASSGTPPVSSLFSLKGALGPFLYDEADEGYGYYTEIYKFDILEDGSIDYSNKAKVKGKTINQYSVDEYNNNLRIALYDDNGSRVVIFDNNLKQVGKSNYVAKGERMYSSRFMGNKLYFVTFKTIDPLFVLDLSNPTSPKVLGELKIPGYSTYLHPYDENHLIGIGMETEEFVRRDNNGKVISTFSNIIGMKMALFDVSDISNPIELSNVVIGDRRTTSAILTNPKALLFSKERQLIAIPVNNYSEDFSISSSDNTSSVISSYTSYNRPYVSEGYFVYNINIDDGFKLKGIITHENNKNTSNYYYSSSSESKLLRGLYIEDNLYTISETAVKVNKLDNLEEISKLQIINKGGSNYGN